MIDVFSEYDVDAQEDKQKKLGNDIRRSNANIACISPLLYNLSSHDQLRKN